LTDLEKTFSDINMYLNLVGASIEERRVAVGRGHLQELRIRVNQLRNQLGINEPFHRRFYRWILSR